MLEKVSSTVRSQFTNTVNGYTLNYGVTQEEGQDAKSVNCAVRKSDQKAGFVTVNADGTRYVSFEKLTSDEDMVAILSTVAKDAATIFEQRNKE